jgi:hypothetical protein
MHASYVPGSFLPRAFELRAPEAVVVSNKLIQAFAGSRHLCERVAAQVHAYSDPCICTEIQDGGAEIAGCHQSSVITPEAITCVVRDI